MLWCIATETEKREKRKQRLKNMTKNVGTKLEEKFTFNKKEKWNSLNTVLQS